MLLLISLESFVAWRSTLRGEEAEVWVVHTLTVGQALESVRNHAVSAENQARGFALTGISIGETIWENPWAVR